MIIFWLSLILLRRILLSHSKPTRKSEVPSFTSLPDEITENILARISRVYYPKLSLVSKSFHSILSSTNIYKTRSQIGTTETCLYVCLETKNKNREWFTLQAKPSQTKTKTKLFKLKSSGHVLVPTPSSTSHAPHLSPSSIIAIGSDIYFIGGSVVPSSAVQILDCRSHTWRDSPNMNMKVATYYSSVVSLDDKIYVMGFCKNNNLSGGWLEVFDIKTQSWTALPSPCALAIYYSMVIVVQGKFHVVAHKKDYTYDPEEGTWKVVSKPSIALSLFKGRQHSCVVENVIYCCTCWGDCSWYDSECGDWKMVKGLENLRENRKCGLSHSDSGAFDMVNYGGNILLVWEFERYLLAENRVLWCAEISLERRCNGSEIWGNIEWADAIYTAPCMSYHFEHSVAVSI